MWRDVFNPEDLVRLNAALSVVPAAVAHPLQDSHYFQFKDGFPHSFVRAAVFI